MINAEGYLNTLVPECPKKPIPTITAQGRQASHRKEPMVTGELGVRGLGVFHQWRALRQRHKKFAAAERDLKPNHTEPSSLPQRKRKRAPYGEVVVPKDATREIQDLVIRKRPLKSEENNHADKDEKDAPKEHETGKAHDRQRQTQQKESEQRNGAQNEEHPRKQKSETGQKTNATNDERHGTATKAGRQKSETNNEQRQHRDRAPNEKQTERQQRQAAGNPKKQEKQPTRKTPPNTKKKHSTVAAGQGGNPRSQGRLCRRRVALHFRGGVPCHNERCCAFVSVYL